LMSRFSNSKLEKMKVKIKELVMQLV